MPSLHVSGLHDGERWLMRDIGRMKRPNQREVVDQLTGVGQGV